MKLHDKAQVVSKWYDQGLKVDTNEDFNEERR